jgi:aspartyl protease family protein
MDGDMTARLVYLSLLLLAVAGSLVTGLRQSPGRTLQQMLIWGFILLGLVGAYGLWPDLQRALNPRAGLVRDGAVELLRAGDGHFYADAEVNGVTLTFVIDTGATDIVLSARDARRAGLDLDTLSFTGLAQTANGTVATAPVRLQSFALGPFADSDVAASVNGGDLDGSLLGMSWLSRFDMAIEGDRLRLTR